MGTWDVGTFDNDTAADWAYTLEHQTDLRLVTASLSAVLALGTEYVDADTGCEALAAAEVVARLRGNWGKRDTYSEVVDRWVEGHPGAPPPALVTQALAAIDRVVIAPSELVDLWTESDDLAGWRAAVAELRKRVAG